MQGNIYPYDRNITEYKKFRMLITMPGGLRHEKVSSAYALESCFRIPLEACKSVCIYLVFVLDCLGSGLATGRLSGQEALSNVCKIRNFRINLN
jgi:hypothetical protein